MIRRLVSLLIAVPASLVGHALLFQGGGMVAERTARFGGDGDPLGAVLSIALVVIGVLLVGVALGTAGWSSAGVLVVGAVQTLVGLAFVVIPFSLRDGSDSFITPTGWVIRETFQLGPAFSTGLAYSLPTGFFLLAGVVLLVIGAGARGRRHHAVGSPVVARIVSLLVALVALVPGIALVAVGGARSFRLQFQLMGGELDLLATALILGGVLVVAGVALGVRWSSLGAIVVGALVTLAGVAGVVVTGEVQALQFRLVRDPELLGSVQPLAVGEVLLIGVLFLVGGIAGRLADRRAARRESYVEPGTGPILVGAGPYGQGPLTGGEAPEPVDRRPSALDDPDRRPPASV